MANQRPVREHPDKEIRAEGASMLERMLSLRAAAAVLI
jgi:hypothetical protein